MEQPAVQAVETEEDRLDDWNFDSMEGPVLQLLGSAAVVVGSRTLWVAMWVPSPG